MVAGDAASDGFVANLEDFGVDAFGGKLLGYFVEGEGGVAILARATVD